ncbi:MAG: hypothetical protein WHS86_15535 [Desulfosoma sp.]
MAHERAPQPVFVGARPFAHEDEPGRRVAFAEDDVCAVAVERATAAIAQIVADDFQEAGGGFGGPLTPALSP